MKIKYVVIQEVKHRLPLLIIFPDYIPHNKLQKMGKIISAGFVNMKTKCCYGESIRLGIKSHPETDNQLLEILLGE